MTDRQKIDRFSAIMDEGGREEYRNLITKRSSLLLQRRAKFTPAGFYGRIREDAEALSIEISSIPSLSSLEITVDQIDRDIWNAIHALQK